MIKAVIFDYVGVLVGQFSPRFFDYLGKIEGVDKTKIESVFKKYWGPVKVGDISYDDFWKGIATDLKIDNIEKVKEFVLRLFEPEETTLDHIKKLSCKFDLYLLSNSCEWSEESYNSMGLKPFFKKAFLSHKLGLAKPDKRIYEVAINDIGLKPEEMIFVDDKIDNVVAANKVGLKGILFEGFEDLIEQKLIKNIKG